MISWKLEIVKNLKSPQLDVVLWWFMKTSGNIKKYKKIFGHFMDITYSKRGQSRGREQRKVEGYFLKMVLKLMYDQSTSSSCGDFKFFTISTFKQIVEIIWLDQIVTISQSLRFLRWLKSLRLQNLKIFGMETILKIRQLSQFCHLHNLFEPWNCEEFKIATTRCCALMET